MISNNQKSLREKATNIVEEIKKAGEIASRCLNNDVRIKIKEHYDIILENYRVSLNTLCNPQFFMEEELESFIMMYEKLKKDSLGYLQELQDIKGQVLRNHALQDEQKTPYAVVNHVVGNEFARGSVKSFITFIPESLVKELKQSFSQLSPGNNVNSFSDQMKREHLSHLPTQPADMLSSFSTLQLS